MTKISTTSSDTNKNTLIPLIASNRIEHASPLWHQNIFGNLYNTPMNTQHPLFLQNYVATPNNFYHSQITKVKSKPTGDVATSTDTVNKNEATPPAVKHVPFVGSPGLLTLTAFSLYGEALTHYVPHSNMRLKILARCLVGALQMTAGAFGVDFYGTKYKDYSTKYKDAEDSTAIRIRSGTMATGYGLFFGEGLLRILESRSKYLPLTCIFGALAAYTKTSGAVQPGCSNIYSFDGLINLMEKFHGTEKPPGKGYRLALWHLGHSLERKHIAGLQGVLGTIMLANAGAKMVNTQSRPADPETAALDAKWDRFFTRLENEEEVKEFEKICNIKEPTQCEKELSKFFDRD